MTIKGKFQLSGLKAELEIDASTKEEAIEKLRKSHPTFVVEG